MPMRPEISLGRSLVYRCDASPFLGDGIGGLGCELLAGGLHLPALERLLPGRQVFVLPVVDHLSMALMLSNLACAGATLRENLRLHLDWPESMRRALTSLATSFPETLVGVSGRVAAAGEYLREGRSLEGAAREDPIYLFHPSEPRRLLLALFGRNLTCPPTLVGGISSTLQWQFLVGRHPEATPVPGELALENGLLPWLTALFAAPLLHDESVSFQHFLDEVLKSSESECHLLVASPETLVTFADACEVLQATAEDLAARGDGLRQGHVTSLQDAPPSPPLTLCRTSGRAMAELSPTLAFVERHFVNQLGAGQAEASWHEAFGRAFSSAVRRSAERYADWTRLEMSQAQERDYFRYVYRLCRDADRMAPSPFEVLLAGQAVVDSNFSFELLKECEDFPRESESRFPEVEIRLSELAPAVSTFSIERFDTLQRKRMGSLRNVKKKMNPRTSEATPVEEGKYSDDAWVHEDHPFSCSFPEEDIFMENFAFQYREQAKEMLRSREIRSHEMDMSLGDGLDLRTTLRHWHEEKIFVFEDVHVGKADVGAIVFQFVEPEAEKEYSWTSYWLAEKHDKSDLMFYATPFADNVIGPGIAKSEFGGFAVIPIPNFLTDSPWHHPFIASRSRSDALVVAAAAATDHRAILFIGPHPPGHEVSTLLKRSGKALIYMKLDELPADKIRHLRTFHILAEAGVRAYAHKYIRKE